MSGDVRVSVFAQTDLGQTRDHNEDTFILADLTTGTSSVLSEALEHAVGPRGLMYLVADGMGGAAAGELASAMAADLIYSHMSRTTTPETPATDEAFAAHLKDAVESANQQIHEYAAAHPDVRGMGTTATVAGIVGQTLYLAQVGDSRAYLVRGASIVQITKDQSLMQRLVDAGELTPEQAEASTRRNIILQALGPEPRVKVELTWQPLRRGDTLVVCSDGLSGMVKREEIGEAVAEAPNLRELCQRLVSLANHRGGPDNITVVCARFDGEGLAAPDGDSGVAYTVVPDAERSGEVPAVTPPPAAPESPPPPVPMERRKGSPYAMVGAIGGVLALLWALFHFLLGH